MVVIQQIVVNIIEIGQICMILVKVYILGDEIGKIVEEHQSKVYSDVPSGNL